MPAKYNSNSELNWIWTHSFRSRGHYVTSLTSYFGSVGKSKAVFSGISPFPKGIQTYDSTNWALQTHHKYSPKPFITSLSGILDFYLSTFWDIFVEVPKKRTYDLCPAYGIDLSVVGIDAEVHQEKAAYIRKCGEDIEINRQFNKNGHEPWK